MNAPLVFQDATQDNENSTDLINIVEIFGPTIQGEGALIGMPTVFVRSGGCDYRCSWCDTGYAVLPKFEEQWSLMDTESIFQQIEKLSKGHPLWVTLSGGNPAIQNFEALIRLGQSKGYKFSMETQASVAQPWFSLLDQLTLSPKPPSTSMSFKMRGLERCLKACESLDNHQVDISLKFVLADKEDIIWAKAVADQYPDLACFVQPCNISASLEDDNTRLQEDSEIDQKRLLWLIEEVQNLHWHRVRVLPQLHRWLWGDQTGV